MIHFSSADDLVARIGAAVEPITMVSEWFLIDQERVDAFAAATDDRQWIHVERERAASGPFGTTIVHGHLLLSLLPALSSRFLSIDTAMMGINYGLDRVRFLTPVLVGTRVRAISELRSAEVTASGLRVKTNVTMEVEGEQKPAMIAEAISLYPTTSGS